MSDRRTDRKRHTLPAQGRLRRKVDFEQAYARGRRFSDAYFSLTARPNELERPRIGLAVAVKAAGNSVGRNRLRRLIRESFRLHQHEIPCVDIVISARSSARSASATQLRASLDALWGRVREQCACS